ncbi:hypothetical protein Tco_1233736 [Tanacetum coccineum]
MLCPKGKMKRGWLLSHLTGMLSQSYMKDEIFDLKRSLKIASSKVTLDQLLTKQVPGNIIPALGGRGKRKKTISSKEVVFTKADGSSSETIPKITFDSESEYDDQEPLPPFPKLSGAKTIGTSVDSKLPNKKADSSAEQLLLTLIKEVKVLKEKIKTPSDNSPSVSQTRSSKSSKGKQKAWFGPWKDPMIPKPYILCKYYGFIDHYSDECEYCPGCDIYGSISHETADCVKKHSSNNRKPRIDNQRSTEPTENGCSRHVIGVKQYLNIYSKESGPKLVFRDNSLGDTEGYGSVNYNGITFTRETIFNQNNEVVFIASRRRDVYVIDISSYNEESNDCFFTKASPSVNWL